MASSKKVTFFVGLPGCGKTSYVEAHKDVYRDACILDDPKGSIEEVIAIHDRIVVCDPMLCMVTSREIAAKMFADFEQEWFFFENDYHTCWDNVRFRDDGRKISRWQIATLSAMYDIPEGATILPVYRGPLGRI